MISIVRSFGAPVIEPPGKQARAHSTGAAVGRQPALDRRDQLVHGRVVLDHHQLGDGDAADLADDAEVVAQQVDDHQVLGVGLFVVGQLGLQRRVLGRVGGARGRPLDRPRLDPALAVDREEALRRGADHGDLAELEEGGEGRRVAAAQVAVEVERIGAGVGRDLVGEADLVGLAGGQFGLASGRCRRGTARGRGRTGSGRGPRSARRRPGRRRSARRRVGDQLARRPPRPRRASARPRRPRRGRARTRGCGGARGRRRRPGWRASAPRRARRSCARWCEPQSAFSS